MTKLLKSFAGLMLAGSLLAAPAVNAATAPAKSKVSKSHKAAPAPAATESKEKDEDDIVPDITTHKNLEYKCELGNTLTLYTNTEDPHHVAMRWKKQLVRMTRVDTSTGANRFENRKAGFVWIGIPAKSMLLDSKKGQQLANECKTTDPVIAETTPDVSAAPAENTTQVK